MVRSYIKRLASIQPTDIFKFICECTEQDDNDNILSVRLSVRTVSSF